jgi:hypothetical protein
MSRKSDSLDSLRQVPLSPATRALIDRYVHQWTPPSARDASPARKPERAPAANAAKGATKSRALASAVRPVVDARLPQLTPVDACLPQNQIDKTNPLSDAVSSKPSPRSLSSRQQAAARLLARGRTPSEVSAELRITRQGLWKWRRTAEFAREVQRMNEVLLHAPNRACS